MAIYVTGDYHGGSEEHWRFLAENWPAGQTLTKDDYVIIAGDVGLYWTNSTEEVYERELLDGMPWTTLFVDGNHENHEWLRALPVEQWCGGETSVIPGTGLRWLRRGQVFEIDGTSIFTMGGAWSIDSDSRTPGVDWFPEELPSDAEIKAARKALAAHGWQVDHIVTHDCPKQFLPSMTVDSIFGLVMHEDPLNRFLDEVDTLCNFRHWWFGHYHKDVDVDDWHTCLMESIRRIA